MRKISQKPEDFAGDDELELVTMDDADEDEGFAFEMKMDDGSSFTIAGGSEQAETLGDADESWGGVHSVTLQGQSEWSKESGDGVSYDSPFEIAGDSSLEDTGGMRVMQMPADADSFVLLEDRGVLKRHVVNITRLVCVGVAFVFGIWLTYFLMSYRIVPEAVKGSEAIFGNVTIISRDYQLPSDEIMNGDILLVSSTPKWSPLVYGYRLYYYQGRMNNVIKCANLEGLNERISVGDVAYVLKGTPRIYGGVKKDASDAAGSE